MERRRILPLAAVALAGLLVGAFLAGGPAPPAAPPPPPPVATPLPGPRPVDTGYAPAPTPPAPLALPVDHADAVEPYGLEVLGAPGRVRCAVEGAIPEDLVLTTLPSADVVGQLYTRGMDGDRLHATWREPVPWRVVGGELVLEAPVGTVLLSAERDDPDAPIRASSALAWDGDEGWCTTPLSLAPEVRLTVAGSLRGVLEDDWVHVDICGHRVRLPKGARTWSATVTLPGTPCLVHAARLDGAIYARSDMVELDPSQGDQDDLVLTMPDDDVGGIGVPVQPHPDGMVLGPPTPGTPAADAGLQAGDVVVAVDGQPVAGWDVYEIIGVVTGQVGTEVELTVVTAEGQEETVRVQRAWIDAREG